MTFQEYKKQEIKHEHYRRCMLGILVGIIPFVLSLFAYSIELFI